jgi:hypothetical protein
VTSIYLEVGKKRVFAAAIDWPGWARSGRDEAQAIEALRAAAPRYMAVARTARVKFGPADTQEFEVVERLPGSMTTDFGAPGAVPAFDAESVDPREAKRLVALVNASWTIFLDVVSTAPLELRKGPRGGGRNRDKIVEHVVNAEWAYARKLGLRSEAAQPRPDDEAAVAAFRSAISKALLEGMTSGEAVARGSWPPRYAARRVAWHVLDHAWEIEDKSPP